MTAASIAHRSGQQAKFEVVPTDAALGAEIQGIDLKRLDEAMFEQIHEAWLDHVLLVFRGQTLAAEDLVNLVRRFGTPVTSSICISATSKSALRISCSTCRPRSRSFRT